MHKGRVRAHLHQALVSTLRQLCNDASNTVLIENIENGLQPHSGVTPLFSMSIVSLVSLQSCRNFDSDAWRKGTLSDKT